MALPPDKSYTFDHKLVDLDTVAFACSSDIKQWPWLALAPHHPGAICAQCFWTSVGASRARETFDEGKWSALTWTRWQCGERKAGHAVRGTYTGGRGDGKISFETSLYDERDQLVVKIDGRGVVFRTRDFESWRERSKQQAANGPNLAEFEFAAPKLLGLSDCEHPFISPPLGDNKRAVQGLITKANALLPGNPYWGGSGDHVNTTHFAELARQVLCLLHDGAPMSVTQAEMDMRRYIELGAVIDVRIDQFGADLLEMTLGQSGRDCAAISLKFQPG